MRDLAPATGKQSDGGMLELYGVIGDRDELHLGDFLGLAAQLCEMPVASLSFLGGSQRYLHSSCKLSDSEGAVIDFFSAWVAEQSGARAFADLAAVPFAPASLGNSFELRACAGACITTADGRILGTVCVFDRQPRQVQSSQLEALSRVARQLMRLLELRRESVEAQKVARVRGDLSVRLASTDSAKTILQGCVELLVDYLNAAFARIWTLDESEGVLILRASAGAYTHLDGPHGRIKVGEFKIGRIAQQKRPHLTNDVLRDPHISDPAWARKEGMVAFAGYPLMVEDRVVGVVAMFFRHTLSEIILRDLEPIAYGIAQCVQRKRIEEALERSEATARFVAQVSADLAELTDFQSTLQKVASASVPVFADWCSVDLIHPSGRLDRVAVAHRDPAKARLVSELHERYPAQLDGQRPISKVLQTGIPEMAEEVPESFLEGIAQDAQHLQMLRELDIRSYLCIPLTSHDKSLGIISFATADSGRRYTALDLMVGVDLARRAAVALENANLYRDLQEASRRKDEFLATLAHELRNPLAPLGNALALLRVDTANTQTVQDASDIMDRQLQQMVRLVDDLLDVSRITRDRIELRREVLTLQQAMRNAVELSRSLIDAAGQEFQLELPADPIYLWADLTRLSQIFSNLLNNASKYTDRGGTIRIWAVVEKADVSVHVTDSGIGISPEMRARIFDLFTQEDRSLERAQGGLGIGLTLSRRLVEMHGGSIEAQSAGVGQGSDFIVRLPIASVREQSRIQDPKLTSEQIPRCRRILVVDDNRDATLTTAKLLRRRGHIVAVAFDGVEAVEVAASFRPEIAFLDIGLPKLNGYEACRRILRAAHQDPPLMVALTGWGQESDRQRAAAAGFAHHVVKPVAIEELQQLLALREAVS